MIHSHLKVGTLVRLAKGYQAALYDVSNRQGRIILDTTPSAPFYKDGPLMVIKHGLNDFSLMSEGTVNRIKNIYIDGHLAGAKVYITYFLYQEKIVCHVDFYDRKLFVKV